MPYDPLTIYKRILAVLGATQQDPKLSRGEYWNIPGIGEMEVNPQRKMGNKNWDAMEIWKPYKEGQIPEWMRVAAEAFSKSRNSLNQDELQGLAEHWINGVGVDPFYAKAQANMPAWMKDYLRGIYGGYLAGGSGQTNPVGGTTGQV